MQGLAGIKSLQTVVIGDTNADDEAQISRINSLADFLAGKFETASIAIGDPERQVFVNTFDVFAQNRKEDRSSARPASPPPSWVVDQL